MIWIYIFIGTAVSFFLRLLVDKSGEGAAVLLLLAASAVRIGISVGILLKAGEMTPVLLFLLICLIPELVLSLYRLKPNKPKGERL